jgi:hypothetical protein
MISLEGGGAGRLRRRGIAAGMRTLLKLKLVKLGRIVL